jgi:hypothetical protein
MRRTRPSLSRPRPRVLVAAVLPALAAAALLVPLAHAGGVSFNWGTLCYTAAPASVKTFACGDNAATHPMTMSFRIDSEMTDMVGLEIELEGVSDAAQLPDWWRLDPTDCRANALSYSGDNTAVASATCADWNGGAGFSVPPGYTWDGNRAHVSTGYAISAAAPIDLQPDVEYYAGTFTLHSRNTVGPGACAGCETGMTWWISRITVAGLAGRRDELTLPMPDGRQFLYWNRAARAASMLALSSTPWPSGYRQPVTLSATLTPPTATGTVEFTEGDSLLGSAPVASGTATLGLPALAEGDHVVRARYGGDDAVERAFSASWTHAVSSRPATAVALTSSPNPSPLGQAVTVTAQVSPPGATGMVTFRDGDWSLATVPIRNGVATFARSSGFTTPGPHAMTGLYGGDAAHGPSLSPVYTHVVGERIPTTVSFTISPNPCTALGWLTTQRTVLPSTATGPVIVVDQTGMSYPTVVGIPCGGTYYLHAIYYGDQGHAPSTSPTQTLTIIPNPNSMASVGVRPAASWPGQEVTLTARVTNTNWQGPCSIDVGAVQFLVNGAPCGGPVPLVIENATLKVNNLRPGSNTVQAHYLGGASLGPCISPVATAYVWSPGLTSAVASSSPNPSCIGQEVTLAATVSNPSNRTPTGTVRFDVDGVARGSVAAVNGTATLGGITDLAPGPHSVRAFFSNPDGLFPACSTSTVTHVVSATQPLILAVDDVPADEGGLLNVTWDGGCPPDSVEAYWVLRAVPSGAGSRAVGTVDAPPELGAVVRLERGGTTGDWEYVGMQPAGLPTYCFLVATAGDSVPGATPRTRVMIEARTVGAPLFSDPASGYSVDNLAPAMPTGFHVMTVRGRNLMTWDPAPETDFTVWRLYRGDGPEFVPDEARLLTERAVTGYMDGDGAGAASVYKLCAVDVHGNAGTYAIAQTVFPTDVSAEALAFALEGVRPNPAPAGRVVVTFTLPGDAAARLEMVDVSGRRVAAREVGTLGAGRHVITMGGGIAPGLYFIRLTQGANTRVARVGVLE